jgi:hypothetical protein
LFGNSQERKRFFKLIAVRTPFEPWLWFVYHYFACLGFLEGRRGLIACQIRSAYIRQVRAKMYELALGRLAEPSSAIAAGGRQNRLPPRPGRPASKAA